MNKNLIKLFFMCASGLSILSATEQQLAISQTFTRPLKLSDQALSDRFEQDLKSMKPVEIVDGQAKISTGDRFSAGNVSLVCSLSLLGGRISKQNFDLFIDTIEQKKVIEDGLELGLSIFFYSDGDYLYYGPYLKILNIEYINSDYQECVIKILQRMFLNNHLHLTINSSERELLTLLTKVGFFKINTVEDVRDVMMTGVNGLLPKPLIYNEERLEDPYLLEDLHLTDLTLISDDNKYKPIIRYVEESLRKVDFDFKKFQIYQWSTLLKDLQSKFNQRIKENFKDIIVEDLNIKYRYIKLFDGLYSIFTHQTLFLLQKLGHIVDLEKGGIVTFKIPLYTQDGKIYPEKQISFFVKGPWCLGRKDGRAIKMPDFFIDVRNKMNPGEYIYEVYYTPKGQKHLIISEQGIETGDFLVVKKEGEESVALHLNGLKDDQPFSLIQKQELDSSIVIGDIIIPIPSGEGDLDVLAFLLSELEREDDENKNLETAQNIEKIEELPDEDFSHEQKLNFMKIQQDLKNEKLKLQKAEQEKRQEERLQRELFLKDEAIKKIEEELIKKEVYEKDVKRQQEARSRQVIKDAEKVQEKAMKRKSRRGGVSSSVNSSTTLSSEETDIQMRQRIKLQAETVFNERRVKLRDVAERINNILKIIPDARSILFRQDGSHMVANGSSAESGPVTFVIPHGGDGTMSISSVNTFLQKFIGLFFKV